MASSHQLTGTRRRSRYEGVSPPSPVPVALGPESMRSILRHVKTIRAVPAGRTHALHGSWLDGVMMARGARWAGSLPRFRMTGLWAGKAVPGGTAPGGTGTVSPNGVDEAAARG